MWRSAGRTATRVRSTGCERIAAVDADSERRSERRKLERRRYGASTGGRLHLRSRSTPVALTSARHVERWRMRERPALSGAHFVIHFRRRDTDSTIRRKEVAALSAVHRMGRWGEAYELLVAACVSGRVGSSCRFIASTQQQCSSRCSWAAAVDVQCAEWWWRTRRRRPAICARGGGGREGACGLCLLASRNVIGRVLRRREGARVICAGAEAGRPGANMLTVDGGSHNKRGLCGRLALAFRVRSSRLLLEQRLGYTFVLLKYTKMVRVS